MNIKRRVSELESQAGIGEKPHVVALVVSHDHEDKAIREQRKEAAIQEALDEKGYKRSECDVISIEVVGVTPQPRPDDAQH